MTFCLNTRQQNNTHTTPSSQTSGTQSSYLKIFIFSAGLPRLRVNTSICAGAAHQLRGYCLTTALHAARPGNPDGTMLLCNFSHESIWLFVSWVWVVIVWKNIPHKTAMPAMLFEEISWASFLHKLFTWTNPLLSAQKRPDKRFCRACFSVWPLSTTIPSDVLDVDA